MRRRSYPTKITEPKISDPKLPVTEYQVRKEVLAHLREFYPDAEYRVDLAADMVMSAKRSAINRNIQGENSWPDVFIAEPRGSYAGMFIELKKDHAALYDTKGNIRKVDRLLKQAAKLQKLQSKGYIAGFACGTLDAIRKIDDYMSGIIRENYKTE